MTFDPIRYRDLGRKIAAARSAAGMDQATLAKATGVSPEEVAGFEAGASRPDRSWLFAAELILSTDHLLEAAGHEPRTSPEHAPPTGPSSDDTRRLLDYLDSLGDHSE